MKKIIVEGQVCVGPNYSKGEIAYIKKNLHEIKGLDTLSNLFEVSGNIQRLKILYILNVFDEMCVCDISEVLEISTSAVSQHIRKMKDSNILKSRRSAQTIFYSLQDNMFIKKLTGILDLKEIKEKYAFV